MGNPFRNRNVIKSEDGFYNRDRELQEIYSLLLDNEDEPQSIALIGQRRIGKSSLLYRIFRKRSADVIHQESLDKTIMVWVQMTSLADCSPKGFFARLTAEIAEQNGQFGNIVFHLAEKYQDPTELFHQVVNQLDREKFRLVILLDEFEEIVRNPALDKPFFDRLRSFMQEKRLAYVLSLQQELHRIWAPTSINSPHTSPFFNPFHSIYLKGFEPNVMREYLTGKFRFAGKTLTDNELEAIIKVGGNFPFFINIAAENLFNRSIAPNFQGVIKEAFYSDLQQDSDINANFEYYWGHLSTHHKLCLLRLCKNQLLISAEVKADLKQLENMSLVCHLDGKYSPFSQLFKDFVLRQTLVDGWSVSINDEDGGLTEQLTEREVQILQLLDKNCSNKEIGAALGIEENTVKTHVSSIFQKLGVNKRGEARDKGRRLGII